MLGTVTMSATSMKPGEEITGNMAMTVTDAMAGTSVTNFVTLTGKAGDAGEGWQRQDRPRRTFRIVPAFPGPEAGDLR